MYINRTYKIPLRYHPALSLYTRIANKYEMANIPAHHAIAVQISFPTGSLPSSARSVSTIDVTGWFSAKTRRTVGMVSVGTNAELKNGRKIRG
jgi:hypothetical protein